MGGEKKEELSIRRGLKDKWRGKEGGTVYKKGS